MIVLSIYKICIEIRNIYNPETQAKDLIKMQEYSDGLFIRIRLVDYRSFRAFLAVNFSKIITFLFKANSCAIVSKECVSEFI